MIDETNDISVSISMITYNQEQYVSQALESILMQNVNFKYEIVIGDDCSPDNTQEVIQKYAEMYSDIIKPILRNENLGVLKNLDDTNRHCIGKYIIILEGDDYWVDANKLQTQFDFLESNTEYFSVAHWCEVVDENGNLSNEISNKSDIFNFKKNIYSLKDYQNGSIPGHLNTILFKNIYFECEYDYAKIFSAHFMVGDRTLYLILVLLSDMFIINKVMSCYRFVRKKGNTNFCSLMIEKNECLTYFDYYSNLEKYVFEVMKKKISLRKLRDQCFIDAIRCTKENPTKENKRIRKTIFNKLNKFEIIIYCISLIIKKKKKLRKC